MSKFGVFTLVLLGGFCGVASADVLEMTPAQARAYFEDPGKPSRGMTQERVAQLFGEPQSRRSAVGDPPISRWEYDAFIVYFEYDKVIHAVSLR